MKFSNQNLSGLIRQARELLVWEEVIKKGAASLNALSLLAVLVYSGLSWARGGTFSPHQILLLAGLGFVFALNLIEGFWVGRLSGKRTDLENKANVDDLTGVWTQARFEILTVEEIRRAGRYHHPLALCLLDLDGFRSVNEHFGRPHGDELLKRVAQILRAAIRFSDSVARPGNDEFYVLLPHTDLLGGEKFLSRVLALVLEHLDCSFSAGITTYRSGESQEAFLTRARLALDHARKEGEKRIRCLIGHDDGYTTVSF